MKEVIYQKDVWPKVLKKYPKVKELCELLDIKTCDEAKNFRNNYKFTGNTLKKTT